MGARVAYTRIPDLDRSVAAITTLSDVEWRQRETSFISQLRLYGGYFLGRGVKLGDPYLLHWAAVHLVNAASRALLAQGRILFRGAKYEPTLLADLPDLPDGFLDLSARLLALPTVEMCEELMALVEDFKDWGIPDEQSLSRFIRDNELAWLNGTLPPEAM